MKETIKVTYLVNTAVLLEYRGIKLFVDGIYNEKGHSFSNLSEEQWEQLKKGEGLLSGIDYLLFTHEHGDHFSPESVMEYLEYQTPKAIFMPRQGGLELKKLQHKAECMGIPCVMLEENLCRTTLFKPEKDICIKVFYTRHLDKIYWDVPHFCYLLNFGEKRIFITGDVDFNHEGFETLQNIQLDAVFINPLFAESKKGKSLFDEGVLQAKRKIVYHIPFSEDDKMQIRKMVERRIRLGKEEDKKTVFLLERNQICYL